ncbi:MAG: extracellular solute-binding protein [Fusobacterium sp. JB019]|nr:extracellular solute-binding protein [Fusobacterium sp. JB019]
MKKIIKIILLASFVLILGACGKKEVKKSLTVYSGLEEEYLGNYVEIFKKDFPDIELNIVRDSQGAIAAKLIAEGKNPQADILWGMASINLIQLANNKSLYEIDSKLLENIDSKFIDKINLKPYWVGMTAWTSALTINKYEIEKRNIKVPESYKELLNSKFNKEIVMPNPASSGTGYLTILGWIATMGEKQAWEYMDALNKNINQYTHSGSAPVKMTMQGEQLIGIGMDSESFRLGKMNHSIITVLPDEGYGWDMEGIALVNKQNIKPEAIEFIKWAISKKMMEEYSKNIGLVSYKGVHTKLDGYPVDFEEKLAKIDFKWAAENRDRILKEWEKRYGKGE